MRQSRRDRIIKILDDILLLTSVRMNEYDRNTNVKRRIDIIKELIGLSDEIFNEVDDV